MFYRAKSNQYIREGVPFEVEGIQYPANWLNLSTPQEKTSLGLKEVRVVGIRKDDKYFWNSESLVGDILTLTATPKDLETCRKVAIDSTNSTAYLLLFPSDWMVVKSKETDVPMDPAWTSYRESVRMIANASRIAYENCNTVDEIAAVIIDWPKDPNAPIEVNDATQEGN